MPDEEAPEYISPKRCLARSFRLSRDRWKQKAADRLGQIKTLKVKARDLRISRELWKQKALHYERALRDKGLLPPALTHTPIDPLPAPVADPPPPPPVVSKKKKAIRPPR